MRGESRRLIEAPAPRPIWLGKCSDVVALRRVESSVEDRQGPDGIRSAVVAGGPVGPVELKDVAVGVAAAAAGVDLPQELRQREDAVLDPVVAVRGDVRDGPGRQAG